MAATSTSGRLRRAARSDLIGRLGKVGLAAQGLCFGAIGALAVGLAVGAGGETTGPQGALDALARHGWSRALLVFLCVGFPCYAVWRLAQALLDRGRMGHGAGGLGRRLIQLVQGGFACLLAVAAVRTLVGAAARPGGERRAAAGMLGWPFGRELVLALGATTAITGVVTAYWGFSRRFEESLALEEMDARARRTATALGIAGLCALGVVLAIVGWFLLEAAVAFDPHAPVGIGGALDKLAAAAYGRAVLGVTAAGLVLFGLFDLLQARYHRA